MQMEKTLKRLRSHLFDAYGAQRPLSDFCGACSVPRSWSSFETRVDANVRRYLANYLAVGALTLTWALLRTPRLLVCLLATACAWALLSLGARGPPPRLGGGGGGGSGGGAARAGVALAVGVCLTVALGGVRSVAWAVFVAFCACAVHVALRARGKGRGGDATASGFVEGSPPPSPHSPAGSARTPPPAQPRAGGAGGAFGSGGAALRARGGAPPPPSEFATPPFHRIAPVSGAPPVASGATPLPDAATLPRPGQRPGAR
jgi:hypothetical protein